MSPEITKPNLFKTYKLTLISFGLTVRQSKPYLPNIQSQNTNVVKFVNGVVFSVFRVVNFGVNPGAFVVGVVDLFWFPLALHKHSFVSRLVKRFPAQ